MDPKRIRIKSGCLMKARRFRGGLHASRFRWQMTKNRDIPIEGKDSAMFPDRLVAVVELTGIFHAIEVFFP